MAINIKIIQHDQYLEVLVWGDYTLEEAIERFPAVISTCRLTGLSKVLIDYRELKGDFAAIQKVIFAMETIDLYDKHLSSGGKEIEVAYVGSPLGVSPYEPGMEIAEKRGLPFKLFTNTDDALDWLNVKRV